MDLPHPNALLHLPRLRRREVRRRLAQAGLVPLRPWGRLDEAVADLPHEARLVSTLECLGPVFTTFGLYLATRVDLLPDGYGAGLASLAPHAEPTPWEVVHTLLIGELGRPTTVVYSAFEEEPFEVGLLFQAHHARLADGEPVVVKVAHPDRDEEVATDLAALSLLHHVFADRRETALPLDTALQDVGNATRHQADFIRQARSGKPSPRRRRRKNACMAAGVQRTQLRPAADPWGDAGTEPCRLPTTCRKGTLRWKAGRRPSGYAGTSPGGFARSATAEPRRGPFSRGRSTFRRFELSDGRLAVPGRVEAMPSAARKIVWEYLLANSTGNPEDACSHLVRLLGRGSREANADELRHCCRQAVPASGDLRGATESDLGALVLAHWRAALALGFRPPVYLTRFFRAFFMVRATATRLAPGQDTASRPGGHSCRRRIHLSSRTCCVWQAWLPFAALRRSAGAPGGSTRAWHCWPMGHPAEGPRAENCPRAPRRA